jgi:2-oxoglutarate ferredoxin oxidoreductase subunit delta
MANKGKLEIDRERCKGCLLCARSCPVQVLEASGEANSWGYYPVRAARGEKCIACGNCYQVCPDVAIAVYKL